MTDLVLQVDDADVRALTEEAVQSAGVGRPLVRYRCSACHALLAQVVVVQRYGPLFVSWWRADTHSVRVNGRLLTGREKKQHECQTWETVSGPVHPQHGVAALLRLPDDTVQEFPDLLIRCETHGDHLAQRNDILEMVRTASKARDVRLPPSGIWHDYRKPRKERSQKRFRFSEPRPAPKTADELRQLKEAQGAHIRRRRAERDTP